MLEHYDGDIFEAPIDILCQGCNCMHIHGGLAGEIKRRFPEAAEVDLRTKKGDTLKLGTYSIAAVKDASKRIKYVVNIYSQFGIRQKEGERATSYDAVVKALELLEHNLVSKGKSDLIIGVPWGIFCGLGGGNRIIIEAVLKSVFESSPVKVMICKK